MEHLKIAQKKLAEVVAQLDRAQKQGQLLNIDRDIILSKIATAYDTIQGSSASIVVIEAEANKKVAEKAPEPQNQARETEAKLTAEPQATTETHQPQPATKEDSTSKVTPQENVSTKPASPATVEVATQPAINNETMTVATPSKMAVPETSATVAQPQPTPLPNKKATSGNLNKTPADTLANKYKDNQKLLNEQIGDHSGKIDVATKLQNRPINDLSKAIGINDKFLFTKELFNGNAEAYSSTIKSLNAFTDLNDAIIFLQENFNWGGDNEFATRFIEIIRRKFL